MHVCMCACVNVKRICKLHAALLGPLLNTGMADYYNITLPLQENMPQRDNSPARAPKNDLGRLPAEINTC